MADATSDADRRHSWMMLAEGWLRMAAACSIRQTANTTHTAQPTPDITDILASQSRQPN